MYTHFTDEQRIVVMAGLIVDKIIKDREQGYPLLKKIKADEKTVSKKIPKKSSDKFMRVPPHKQ